jgi:WhiB family redox-sensing transcriptional regulator
VEQDEEGAVIENRGDEVWQTKAACRGPHAIVFFPPSHAERKEERLARERAAKEICRPCPVRQECLDYAIRIREAHGIWGGLSEVERKQIIEREVIGPRAAASA